MARVQGAHPGEFINVQETADKVKINVQMEKQHNDVGSVVDSALSSGRQSAPVVEKTRELTEAITTASKNAAVSVATGAKQTVVDAPKVAAHHAQEVATEVRHRAVDNLQATKNTLSNTIHRAQETATATTDRISQAAHSVAKGASDVFAAATGATNGFANGRLSGTTWGGSSDSSITRGLFPTVYGSTMNTAASVFRGARDVAEVLASTLGGTAFALVALSKRLARLPLDAANASATTALGAIVASAQRLGQYSGQLRTTTKEAYTNGWQRTRQALQSAEQRVVDVGVHTTERLQEFAHDSADKVYSLQQLGVQKTEAFVGTAKGTTASVLQGGKDVAGVATSTAYKAAGTVEGYAEGALNAASHTVQSSVNSAKHVLESTVGAPAEQALSTVARGYEQGRGAAVSVVHGVAETASAVIPDHVPSVGEVGCVTKQVTKEAIDKAAATAKRGVDITLGPVSNC